jgi:hypothetical protein
MTNLCNEVSPQREQLHGEAPKRGRTHRIAIYHRDEILMKSRPQFYGGIAALAFAVAAPLTALVSPAVSHADWCDPATLYWDAVTNSCMPILGPVGPVGVGPDPVLGPVGPVGVGGVGPVAGPVGPVGVGGVGPVVGPVGPVGIGPR